MCPHLSFAGIIIVVRVNQASCSTCVSEDREDGVSEFLLQTQHACSHSSIVCCYSREENQ